MFNMQEYTAISKLKQFHITRSLPNLSQFTVFVCGIPRSTEEPLSDTVRNFFFTRYHGPSYLPYQIVYRVGKSKKLWYAILSHLMLLMGLMYCSPLVIYMNISNSIWMEGHLLVTMPARTLFFLLLTSGRNSELKTETARDALTVFKCKNRCLFSLCLSLA